jgi:hypothetical protein
MFGLAAALDPVISISFPWSGGVESAHWSRLFGLGAR